MNDEENGGEDAARCDICGQLHGDNGHDHEAPPSLESLKAMLWAIRRQAIVSGVDFPTPALDADIKKAGGG